MKKVIKGILDNISIIVLLIIIILATVNEGNMFVSYIVLDIFAFLYFLTSIIKNKKIITNKIDVYMMALAFSTLIPIIFKTYVSLTDTVYNMLKYFSIFTIFVITKNECKKNSKNATILINVVLISICILSIIGLDEIKFNYLKDFKEFLNYKEVQYDEIRVSSLFGYPNAMAAICGVGIFLSIACLFKDKTKKTRIMHFMELILITITFIYTYSRLAYLILTLFLGIFIYVLCKKYNIKKYITKEIIIYIFLILCGLSLILFLGLRMDSKVVLKESENYQKILYKVNSNENYIFEFDIEKMSNIKIKITEKNEFFDDVNIIEKSISSSGEDKYIAIPVRTTKDTSVIYLNIYNLDKKENVIISKAKLNNDKLILKYKFLPTRVIDKLQSINLKNKSAWERLTFIQESFELISKNWIFGLGANAWGNCQSLVQNYNYYAKETHCYLTKVFLENGIIGFLACVLIGGWIVKKLINSLKKEIDIYNAGIIIGVTFLLVHGLLDFDLSYAYSMIIVAIIIAIIGREEEENIKYSKIFSIILSIILILVAINNLVVTSVKEYYNRNTQFIVITETRTEKDIFEMYNKLLPFDANVKKRLYLANIREDNPDYKKIASILKSIIEEEKYSLDNVQLKNIHMYISLINHNKDLTIDDEEMNYIMNKIISTENFYKYKPDVLITRWQALKFIENDLKMINENYSKQIYDQLNKEIEDKEKYIYNYKKCRYPEEKVEEYRNKVEELLKE